MQTDDRAAVWPSDFVIVVVASKLPSPAFPSIIRRACRSPACDPRLDLVAPKVQPSRVRIDRAREPALLRQRDQSVAPGADLRAVRGVHIG
jgi:hypothetical protein